jgi:hypothetical protein
MEKPEQINGTPVMAGSGKISFRQGAKGYRHIRQAFATRHEADFAGDDNLCSVHLL